MSENTHSGAKSTQKSVAGERVVGIVKWFNEQKGFGFIEQPNGRDLFVHYTECRGKIKQGDKVEYTLGEGQKGPCAAKVRVIASADTIAK